MTDPRERLEPCPFCGSEVEMRPLYTLGRPAPTAFRPKCRCGVVGRSARTEVEAVAAWNRRTPSQSPDGYEVQWRPRGSDTWDGGSAGVYRTPEIAAEVVREFTHHETRVRPIAYLDGNPSQSPYPPDTGRTHWEGCWRERGHHNCAVAEIERLRDRLAEVLDPFASVTRMERELDAEEAARDLPPAMEP